MRPLMRAQKGEPPARVPPLTPSCASLAQGEFRALRRAAMGSAPGPRPLFCKKAGQKTFTGPDFCQPKPLAAAASDSIRPRSGHLSGPTRAPKASGRGGWGHTRSCVGTTPSAFLWGSTPFLWASTKEMGWNRQHKAKSRSSKTASSSNAKSPRAGMEPHPYRDSHRTWTTATDMGFVQTAGKKQKWPAILRKRGNFASRALTKILPWRKIIKKFEARRRGLFD